MLIYECIYTCLLLLLLLLLFMNPQFDRQYLETQYREGNSHNSYMPHFQRPLLRKHVVRRV
ncbi:hypothetical protein ACMBCM_08920, partial [Spiroplasma sp. K1]